MIISSVCQHKDINKIENQSNKDFCNICDGFLDNKQSIHVGEDKTKKKLLLISKGKITKNFTQHGYIQVKQHSIVKYLRCLFDETISGDAMALNVVNKINNKQKFIYRYFF